MTSFMKKTLFYVLGENI